jgi:phosphoribosylformylglycinamidine synthase
LGEFNNSGKFEILYEGKRVADLDLKFLHQGVPQLEITAIWKGPSTEPQKGSKDLNASGYFEATAGKVLLELLARPNIASKEWLIRQYDHEVQGMSVIKPLHTSGAGTPQVWSGPNDAGVVKPKVQSDLGLAVGCGINPKLSDIDPFVMAQSAVDEAVRNVICVGAEYGTPDSVLALVDNFCWPDPVKDPVKAGALVRACYGLRNAALELSTPLVSGKDSMKNDFRGKLAGKEVTISVPPTLLMTAVARVSDVKKARTADFKSTGDLIYLVGPATFGLLGSELQVMMSQHAEYASLDWGSAQLGLPNWEVARRVYSWLGGAQGRCQEFLKSVHDVSEGGVLVSIAECLLARGLGASITISSHQPLWEFFFGEGFHSFVATAAEGSVFSLESEWNDLGIPYVRIGTVENQDRLEVFSGEKSVLNVGVKQIRSAWLKEGFWE